MLRTAILGCGPRGAAHAAAYAAGVGAGSLQACCDLDLGRLEAFAARFSIPQRFADPAAMLRQVRPDLLHVVVGPEQRAAVLPVLLQERPRAVLVEKPLARGPDESAGWTDGCAAAGVPLFLNHHLRYHRPFAAVRAAIAAGALGRIEFGRGSCRGNLLEQGTHLFDLLSFMLGDPPVTWVLAQAEGAEGYAGNHSSPTYCAGVACFAPDLHVSFECGPPAGTWRREPVFWWNKGVEFVGERGRAGASTNHGWWVQTEAGLTGESVAYDPEDLRAQAALTESILRSLDSPQDHPAHIGTAGRSFDLVIAAQRSALLRRRVDPREPARDAELAALRAALEGAPRA